MMLAASFWSLLEPALEQATESWGHHSFVPVVIGFSLGALFVWLSDLFLPEPSDLHFAEESKQPRKTARSRRKRKNSDAGPHSSTNAARVSESPLALTAVAQVVAAQSKRRIMLLIMAVTLHNFPEGLAVGVAFGGIGSCEVCTFEAARVVAIGIGLQNFPEGLSVSIPLRRMGYSKSMAFFYGQLSGMVEPIGGLLGSAAVSMSKPLLPYALSFAAGAMVFVVVDSVVPESNSRGNGKLASWGVVTGFLIMMSMDVAL